MTPSYIYIFCTPLAPPAASILTSLGTHQRYDVIGRLGVCFDRWVGDIIGWVGDGAVCVTIVLSIDFVSFFRRFSLAQLLSRLRRRHYFIYLPGGACRIHRSQWRCCHRCCYCCCCSSRCRAPPAHVYPRLKPPLARTVPFSYVRFAPFREVPGYPIQTFFLLWSTLFTAKSMSTCVARSTREEGVKQVTNSRAQSPFDPLLRSQLRRLHVADLPPSR